MANGQIRFGVGFDVDKSGLQSTLKDIESIKTKLGSISASASFGDKMNKELQEAGKTASQLSDILSKSFNTNLGTINVTKFKTELAKTGMTISDVRQKLSGAGAEGKAAFAQVGSALLSTNVQLKQSNKLLDEMATSMANTVKWGITSSIFNNISNSVQDAYHYVKQLDSSLNDIRIVTDKSAESMAKFAVQANNAAKNLGASTRDYTDASLIYYQQGLGEADVAARAETTLKAANVTGQNTAEVSEQLTAVWNGYKVSASEAELYVDKLAAVAATTASDLEELSTGMSKVASAANLMGVDVDSLNAQLATIVSVTRQAPESVGTALKTIYARMGDIETGVDTETTLGNYTAEMEAMGFNVLDANGKLRDMGDVIEEIGGKWNTLSREQQIALSQTMAGTRQYNNLLSLFDNWDMYTEAMETSANAAGTLQKQQDIYMESTAAHLQELSTTAEDVYDTLIKPEEINALLDVFINGIDVLGTFFDTFGGGVKSMVAGAAIMSSVFSKQIGQGLISLQTSKSQAQNNKDLADVKKDAILKQWEGKEGQISGVDAAKVAGYEKQSQLAQDILEVENGITEEQYQQMTTLQNELGALAEEKELIQQNLIAENEKLGISKELTLALQEGGDALENYNSQLLNIQTNLGDAKEELETLNQKNKELLEWQRKIQEMDRMSPQALKKEKKALNKSDVGKALVDFYEDHGSNAQKAIKKDIEENNKKLKEQEKIVQDITKSVNKQEQAYDNVIKAQEKRKNIEDQETEKQAGFDQMKIEAEKADILQNSVDLLTNSLSSLMTVWGAINSLGTIWNNEDLTTGEKLIQTFMTLGTTVPMLIHSYKELNSLKGKSTILTEAYNKVLQSETLNNIKNALSEEFQQEAKEETTEETVKQTVALVAETNAQDANTVSNSANAASEVAQGTSKGATSVVINGLDKIKKAAKGVGIVLSTIAKIIPGWGWAIAGVATVIGGAIAIAHYQATKLERELEEATQAADIAKSRFEEVNTEYNQLMSDIQNYEEAANAINKMVAGTTEWKKAVEETNQQVLQLLQTYPELAAAVANVNGKLVLNTDSKAYSDWLKSQEQKQAGASYYQAITTGQQAELENEKKNRDAYEEFARDTNANVGLSEEMYAGYDKLGNLIYDESKINTAILTSVSGAAAKDAVSIIQEYGSQILDHEEGELPVEFMNAMRERGYQDDSMIAKIALNTTALIQLANSVDANSVALDASTFAKEASVHDYLAAVGNITYNSADGTPLQGAIDKKVVQSTSEGGEDYNAAKEFYDQYDNPQIKSKYLEFSGLTEEELKTKQEQDKNFDEEAMKQEMILADALNRASQRVDEYANQITATLDASSKYLSGENAESLLASFIGGAKGDLNQATESQIAQLEKNKLSLANKYQEYGFESADAFLSAIEEAIANRRAAIEAAGGDVAYSKQQFEKSEKPAEVRQNAEELATYSDQGIASTSSESFIALKEQAKELSEMYPQLRESLAEVMNPAIMNTEEYTKSLHNVADAMAIILAMNSEDGLTIESLNAAGITTLADLERGYYGLNGEIENYQELRDEMQAQEVEALGLTQDAYNEYVDTIADAYKEQNEGVEITEDIAEGLQEVAIANAKIEKGLNKVSEKYKDWNKVLKEGNKDTLEYSQTLSEFKEAATDILGVEVSDDFLIDNMELFQQAAAGSEEALNQLRTKAAEPIIQDIVPKVNSQAEAKVYSTLNSLTNIAPEIEVGANLDTTGYTAALNEMLANGEMTAEQVSALLSSIGFDPVVEYRTEYVETQTDLKVMTKGFNGAPTEAVSNMANKTLVRIPVINGKSTIKKSSPVGSSKPSSSGGGGGGGKNQGGDAITDFFEDEIDIYHEINTQLEILEKNYDKLHKAQEKLTGSALIDNLKEQTKVINDQIKALETKRKIAEQEARTIKKQELDTTDDLQEQYNNLTKKQKKGKKGKELKKKLNNSKKNDLYSGNLYLEYTDQGTIANYDEVLRSEQAAIQKMEKAYNAKLKKAKKGGVSDKEQKSLDKELAKIEKAKANYEELKSSMNNYDELMSQTIADIDQQMRDLYDQKIEIQIETFDSKLQLRLDSTQLERDYNDFLKEINEDDDNGIVEDMKINKSSMQTYESDIKRTKQQLAEAQAAYETISKGGIDATFGDNAAAALEKVKEYQKLLTEQLLDYKEVQEEVHEQYLDLLNSMNEQFDEQYEAYERINDELEHLGNLQSKLLGEQSYDEINKILDGQIKNSQAQIDAKKKEIDAQKKIRDAAKEGSEEWELANERILQAEADIRSLTESTIDAALTKYENRINKIFDDAEKKAANMSFEDADKEWESFATYDSEFLDDINRAYGVNDFKDRAEDAINSANSIRAQEMLNALKDDELNKLKEKNKLTQYDVDRANKMLDITLKQIALEEAQNNKSKMRLRRDSQGNYSYQYVADNDQVDKLQDELDKAKNELYNFDKAEYKENVQKVKNQYAMMQEELKELMLSEDYKQADKETQAQMVNSVTSRHEGVIQGLVESNNRIRANIGQSALDEALAEGVISQQEYDNMTVEQKENFMNNLLGIWDSGYQNIANLLNGEGGFSTQVSTMLTSSNEAVGEFQTTVNGVLENTGEKVKDWATLISDETSTLTGEDGAITKVSTAFDDIRKTFVGEDGKGGLVADAQTVMTQIGEMVTKFTEMQTAAENAAKAAKDAIQASNAAGADAAKTSTEGNTVDGSTPPTSSTINQENAGTSTSTHQDGKLEKGDSVTVAKKVDAFKKVSGKNEFKSNGHASAGTYIVQAKPIAVGKKTYVKLADGKWVQKKNVSGYDTGGYTGDWKSSEGRLAFLHQKELVLNAKDTENMLRMTKITRQMMRDMNPELLQRQYEEMANSLRAANNREWKVAKNQIVNELQSLTAFKEEMAKKIIDMEAANYSFTELTQSIMNKMQENIMAKYNFTIDKIKNQVAEFKHSQKEKDVIDQKVHIEATFPNVSQSHEIENAFNNLINIAAQRAYRTKK